MKLDRRSLLELGAASLAASIPARLLHAQPTKPHADVVAFNPVMAKSTYYVGASGCPYRTIQEAIAAIDAGVPPTESVPAVIYVFAGLYTMTSSIVVPQWVNIVGICEDFPVILQNNETDIFRCSGNNRFAGLTIAQGRTPNTWVFNAGNCTDITILRCNMWPTLGTDYNQGFLTASGSHWKRISMRDCIINNCSTGAFAGQTDTYMVQLVNTSPAVRFCDSWFQECFIDSYCLTSYGGGFNLVNVQDVRIERCTLRGSETYNTSVRCTWRSGITGTPQVDVRHCYCAGGVPLYCDAGTHMVVVNTDAAGAAFSGTTHINNSYTGPAYNPLGPI